MSQEPTSTPLLLETIKIEDGEIHNLSYHQDRCTKSRRILFHSSDVLDLSSIIVAPKVGVIPLPYPLWRELTLYRVYTLHSKRDTEIEDRILRH